MYLLRFSLFFFNQPVIAPRLTSLFFGSLFVIIFYLIIKLNFNKKTAFFSSLLLSFYSLHINLSILSLGEIPANFFLFSSLLIIIRPYKQHLSLTKILLSSLLLSISFSLRSEVIIFIIPLTGYIIFQDKKKGLIFICLSLVVPAIWAFLNWKVSGDFLWRLSDSNIASKQVLLAGKIFESKMNFLKKLIGLPSIIAASLSIPVVILSLLGMINSLRKRENLFFIFAFMLLFFIFSYKLITNSITPLTRYGLTGALLAIPFAVNFILHLSEQYLSKEKIIKTILFFIFSAFISYSLSDAWKNKGLLPPQIEPLSLYLSKIVSPQDHIIIDQDEWSLYLYDILVRSNLSPKQIFIVRDYWRNNRFESDKEEITNYIKQEHPKFLLYCSSGMLKSSFPLSLDVSQSKILDYNLKKIASFKIDSNLYYYLYKFL